MKQIQVIIAAIIGIVGFILAATIIIPGLFDIAFGVLVGWAFLSVASSVHYDDDVTKFIESTKARIKRELRS